MKQAFGALLALAGLLVVLIAGGTAGAAGPYPRELKFGAGPQVSGSVEEGREANLGTGITECPQAGNTNPNKPLDKREIDQVEQISSRGGDRRSNADYSCFPHDEVSVDVNPKNARNFVIGANDYRLGRVAFGDSHSLADRFGYRPVRYAVAVRQTSTRGQLGLVA